MLFSNKKQEVKGSDIRRIQNMDVVTLRSWFDSTLMGLGSSYDRWRFHDSPAADVSEHLNILNELWRELLVREHTRE